MTFEIPPNSLQDLFMAIASAKNETELRSTLMDNSVGEHFGAIEWGMHLYDKQSRLASVDIRGIKNVDWFVEQYRKLLKQTIPDPLLNYVQQYHAPVHDEIVFDRGGWKKSPMYRDFCAYYNHEHIAIAPIVGDGRLVGGIYFARIKDTPAFNHLDIAKLSGICTHFSATLAALRSKYSGFDSPLAASLTPRELQIAELVAQGLTNAEIGAKLWITQNTVKATLKRIFRKLNVSARAQMVARLQDILR
ncbi:MAG: LuxR C-terminal-related transcriptional regulator [Prochloraceae cyanobacterium]